ncbi:hypothetical protein AAHE18_20G154100 [Arachis hypogaea]
MDTRTEVRRERESAWDSYMPCHFLDQVVKTLSRCLGLDPTTTQSEEEEAASLEKDGK